MRRYIIAAVLAVIVFVIVLVSCSSSPSGFNNTTNLDRSVQQQLNDRLAGTGEYATKVVCNPLGGTQYQCVAWGNEGAGDTTTFTVTVTPNGQSWASNN